MPGFVAAIVAGFALPDFSAGGRSHGQPGSQRSGRDTEEMTTMVIDFVGHIVSPDLIKAAARRQGALTKGSSDEVDDDVDVAANGLGIGASLVRLVGQRSSDFAINPG